MSKIFEALQKAGGDVAELTLPLVTQDAVDSTSAQLVEHIVRETAAGQEPALPVARIAENISSAPHHAASAPETPASAHTHEAPRVPGMRTVAIYLSADSPVLPFDATHRRAGEQYRIARTKLIHHPLQPRLIVISSAGSGDGKTVTSVNLAGAMALKSDAQILLVDADLRRSRVANLLGIPGGPGLGDVLSGGCALEDAIVQLEQFPNLCVLPGGKPLPNPTELLDSNRWTSLCAAVRRQFKYVIFDAPPMATVADYDLIQAHCDGVVIVVRPDHTDRKLCMQAIDMTPKERLVGVIVNCVRDWFLWKTSDYYSSYGEEN